MYSDIEALVLSGEFFGGPGRSSSPARSASPDHEPDPGWHDEELKAAKENGLDYDSDTARRDARRSQQKNGDSIGMGPGRTGVKGVIRDRDEAIEVEREKRAEENEDLRKKMEASNLGGKTFLEEEREKADRGEKADELVLKERGREREKVLEKRDVFGQIRDGRFGHLREVGLKGFLSAVEKEEKGIWVVVHLYDSSLERCYNVDETLAHLARLHPNTKFLRAKASALGFAQLNPSKKPSKSASRLKSRDELDDGEDPYPYDEKDQEYDDEEEDDSYHDDNVDLDVLPTMLVYQNGELVHNWVRVDWEAGTEGIEEFLDKHHILPESGRKDNLGLPSDDEDFDLMWSDDDDVTHDL